MVVGILVIMSREGLFPNHAIKPGQSSKLEAVIGFDDCGGSTNSPLGAERFWIEMCSMEERIKEDKR